MFALPNTTEIKKTISKKSIYEKFKNKLTSSQKSKFDNEISKITLINEISEQSTRIPKTENVTGIFVIKVELKTKDYSESNIVLISKTSINFASTKPNYSKINGRMKKILT